MLTYEGYSRMVLSPAEQTLCSVAADFLRQRSRSHLGTALVAELDAIVGGGVAAGPFVVWKPCDAHQPPLDRDLLVAGRLYRAHADNVHVAGFGQASIRAVDAQDRLRWVVWPSRLDIDAWAELPSNDDPAAFTMKAECDATSIVAALLRAASSRIWMLEAFNPFLATRQRTQEEATVDRHALSTKIAAWMPKANTIEWIGPWIQLKDEKPKVGGLVFVGGRRFGEESMSYGIGRWGIGASDHPLVGHIGASDDWFTRPPNIQITQWRHYPEPPTSILRPLRKLGF